MSFIGNTPSKHFLLINSYNRLKVVSPSTRMPKQFFNKTFVFHSNCDIQHDAFAVCIVWYFCSIVLDCWSHNRLQAVVVTLDCNNDTWYCSWSFTLHLHSFFRTGKSFQSRNKIYFHHLFFSNLRWNSRFSQRSYFQSTFLLCYWT